MEELTLLSLMCRVLSWCQEDFQPHSLLSHRSKPQLADLVDSGLVTNTFDLSVKVELEGSCGRSSLVDMAFERPQGL